MEIVNDPVTGEILNLKRISEMADDEVAYVVPWAYDLDERVLNTKFHVHPDESGTHEMKVFRSGKAFFLSMGAWSGVYEQ